MGPHPPASAVKTELSAAGELMAEHRLIERMIRVLSMYAGSAEAGGRIPHDVMDTAVRFFKFYADLRHHGKEESILFRTLDRKKLPAGAAPLLKELLAEHAAGRQFVSNLSAAAESYRKEGKAALPGLVREIRVLCRFYSRHIEKEDRRLFIPALRFFSRDENSGLSEEFERFDSYLPKEDFEKTVAALETRMAPEGGGPGKPAAAEKAGVKR